MPSPTRIPDRLWASTIRDVGHYFAKIGESLVTYAEEAEKAAGSYAADEVPSPPTLREGGTARPSWPSRKKGPRGSTDFAYGYPPSSRHPAVPMYYDYVPVPVGRHGGYATPEAMEARDEHGMHAELPDGPLGGVRRKRMGSSSGMEPERESREGGRGRPSKRVRVNWTEEENKVFFDTITKYSTLDESGMLKQIVKALEGSRNWVQCKGHFRNLVVVGKIELRGEEDKYWAVVKENAVKKPAGRSVASREDSSGGDRKTPRQETDGEKLDKEVGPGNADERLKDADSVGPTGLEDSESQKRDGQIEEGGGDEFVDSDVGEDRDVASIVDEELPDVEVEDTKKLYETDAKVDADGEEQASRALKGARAEGLFSAKSQQKKAAKSPAEDRSGVPLKKQGAAANDDSELRAVPFRRIRDGTRRRMPQARSVTSQENGRAQLRHK